MLDIGIQILKAIELLHLSGKTHNDIKLDNIMLNETNGNIGVVLIDYGLATKFKNEDGTHLKKHEVD